MSSLNLDVCFNQGFFVLMDEVSSPIPIPPNQARLIDTSNRQLIDTNSFELIESN